MITKVKYSIYGAKDDIHKISDVIGSEAKIFDYPAESNLLVELIEGTESQVNLEIVLCRFGVRVRRYPRPEASSDEISSAYLLVCDSIRWLEADKDFSYGDSANVEECKKCGRKFEVSGQYVYGARKELKRQHLARYPRTMLLASEKLVALIKEHDWSGVSILPAFDSKTGNEMEDFFYLKVDSILPPLPDASQISRSVIPDHCEECKRIGYQMSGPQLTYFVSIREDAKDWNFTREWFAPHYVSTPKLVCKNSVATALSELDKKITWQPVVLS